MDGVVAALDVADRPRRPGIGRTGVEGVVRPLAERGADRVDRRKVDDVEPHRRGRLEPLVGGVERAGDPAAGSPRRSGRPGNAERTRTRRRTAPPGGRRRWGSRGGGDQLARTVRVIAARTSSASTTSSRSSTCWPERERSAAPRSSAASSVAPACVGPFGRAVEQRLALPCRPGDVDAGRDLDLGVVHPRLPRITPALDPEGPGPSRSSVNRGGPPVEAERCRRVHRPAAFGAVRVGGDDRGVHRVVALAEHGRPDRDRLADRRLRRVGAALDHRRDLGHRYAPERDPEAG